MAAKKLGEDIRTMAWLMILAINLSALKLFAAQELPEPKVASVYYEASDGFPLLCPITFSDKWTSVIHILWQTLAQLSEMLCEEPFFIVILNLFLFNLMLRLFKRDRLSVLPVLKKTHRGYPILRECTLGTFVSLNTTIVGSTCLLCNHINQNLHFW